MKENLIGYERQPGENRTFKERVLPVSKRVDELQIIAGVVIAPILPVVAAGLIGPSFVTRVIADKELAVEKEKRAGEHIQPITQFEKKKPEIIDLSEIRRQILPKAA